MADVLLVCICLGGDAIEVYNAGIGVGTAETERAYKDVKYEFSKDKYYIGVQTQFYGIVSDSISGFGDASIAGYYLVGKVKFGSSYSRTFDGVIDPEFGEAIYGDQYLSIFNRL